MSEVNVLATTHIEIIETNGAMYQRSLVIGYKGGQNPDGSPKITQSYDSTFLGYIQTGNE